MENLTLETIENDLNNCRYDCLYHATGQQIEELIATGKIDKRWAIEFSDFQEELKEMLVEELNYRADQERY
tara:strand:+ start:164 stop:376 length:213 start_codon:yes stop_codon:yes gene_type:complete